jgi:hypothetical protein
LVFDQPGGGKALSSKDSKKAAEPFVTAVKNRRAANRLGRVKLGGAWGITVISFIGSLSRAEFVGASDFLRVPGWQEMENQLLPRSDSIH